MSSVTVGFVPRERFAIGAEALQRVLDCTEQPYDLVIVDGNTPEPFRSELEAVAANSDNVKWLRSDRYLLQNESRNLVLDTCDTDFLCLIDNDVLVQPGWLGKLVEATEASSADIAVPLIYQGRESTTVHMTWRLGPIEEDENGAWSFTEYARDQWVAGAERQRIETFEPHCVLYRRTALEKLGRFDERLNVSEHIDTGLGVHAAGLSVVLEPNVQVRFLPPPPVRPEEQDFFKWRWDREMAATSDSIIRSRWPITNFKSEVGFTIQRQQKLPQPLHKRATRKVVRTLKSLRR